jgi:membrane protein insertase Oxa1/YidC/SpoIIIJ
MLQRTAPETSQETGFRRIIRTFDPEVPGYVFWPIIFGVAAAFQQLVIRL